MHSHAIQKEKESENENATQKQSFLASWLGIALACGAEQRPARRLVRETVTVMNLVQSMTGTANDPPTWSPFDAEAGKESVASCNTIAALGAVPACAWRCGLFAFSPSWRCEFFPTAS